MGGTLAIANEHLAENLVEAENAHDYDRLFSVVADGFVLHRPRLERGKDALRRMADAVYAAFPDHRRTVQKVMPGDRFVVLQWRFSGTHLGPLGALQPTGRNVLLDGCSIWELADLRLVGSWCFADESDLMRQLGVGSAAPRAGTDAILVVA